jgi:hypothetical protein
MKTYILYILYLLSPQLVTLHSEVYPFVNFEEILRMVLINITASQSSNVSHLPEEKRFLNISIPV